MPPRQAEKQFLRPSNGTTKTNETGVSEVLEVLMVHFKRGSVFFCRHSIEKQAGGFGGFGGFGGSF